MRTALLLFLLSLTSCTTPFVLGGMSEPPAVPQGPVLPVPDAAPEPLPPTATLMSLPPPPLPPTEFPPLSAPFRPAPPPPARKGPAKPEQVIEEGHKAALVKPSARGYFGNSAIQRFIWQPGKLYEVRVSPVSPTKFILPPGHLLAVGLYLDPEDWDVGSATVGTETRQQSMVLIRPKIEKGEINLSLITESGASFDVHLIVVKDKEPMFGVTWEMPMIEQIVLDDQPIFPKPR